MSLMAYRLTRTQVLLQIKNLRHWRRNDIGGGGSSVLRFAGLCALAAAFSARLFGGARIGWSLTCFDIMALQCILRRCLSAKELPGSNSSFRKNRQDLRKFICTQFELAEVEIYRLVFPELVADLERG